MIVELIEGIKDRTYVDPVRSWTRRARIEPKLANVYVALLSAVCPTEQTIMVDENTLRFHISDFREYRTFQHYPETGASFPVLPDIMSNLESNDVFWDVGANVGIYTCFAAESLPSGRVISFEPNPNNLVRIRKNLDLNQLSADTYQLALLDEEGSLTLDVEMDDIAGSYGRITDAAAGITVDATSGDGLVAGDVQPPDVMKIDVEGVEFRTLLGLERTITETQCRSIYCNVIVSDPRQGSSGENVVAWLKDRDFSIRTLWRWSYGPYEGRYIRADRM